MVALSPRLIQVLRRHLNSGFVDAVERELLPVASPAEAEWPPQRANIMWPMLGGQQRGVCELIREYALASASEECVVVRILYGMMREAALDMRPYPIRELWRVGLSDDEWERFLSACSKQKMTREHVAELLFGRRGSRTSKTKYTNDNRLEGIDYRKQWGVLVPEIYILKEDGRVDAAIRNDAPRPHLLRCPSCAEIGIIGKVEFLSIKAS